MCWLGFVVQYVKICSDQQALCFHTCYVCMQEWVQMSLTVVFLFASANCVHGTKKYGTATSFYILSEFVLCKWYQWMPHNPGNWNIVKAVSANYKIACGLNSDILCERHTFHRPGYQYCKLHSWKFDSSPWIFTAQKLPSFATVNVWYNLWCLQQDSPNKLCCVQHDVTVPYLQNNEVIYYLQNFKVFNFSKLDF
jgi:hypothetical protein